MAFMSVADWKNRAVITDIKDIRLDYEKIVNHISDDNTRNERGKFGNILKQVLKLLDSDGKETYDPCMNFLGYSFFNWFPDYFFTESASSTGKYHPAFANGPHGLMLHSLAVVRFANELYDILPYPDPNIKNLLLVSAWIHDMFKYGDPDIYKLDSYTVFEHPVLAANMFKDPAVIDFCKDKFKLSVDNLVLISELINTHMGPYNKSAYSNIILDVPKTPLQKLLFKADYFASRKELDIVKDIVNEINQI